MIQTLDLNNVSYSEVIRTYLSTFKPIIIKNAFNDSKINHLTSADKFREVFGHLEVPVTTEYTRALNKQLYNSEYVDYGNSYVNIKSDNLDLSFSRGETDVSTYLEYIKKDPSTPLLCPEVALPEKLDSYLDIPDFKVENPLYSDDYWCNFFLGNKGNYAHLHYDWNAGVNLFYQVFGKKRITLFDPFATTKLIPFSNFSAVYMEQMNDLERSGFNTFAGCVLDITLDGGDALLIPPLYWHFIEYVETGASLNFRSCSHRLASYLSINHYKSPLFQMYIHDLITTNAISDGEETLLRKLNEIYTNYNSSLNEVYLETEEIYKQLFYERELDKKTKNLLKLPLNSMDTLVTIESLRAIYRKDFEKETKEQHNLINKRPTMNRLYHSYNDFDKLLNEYKRGQNE